MSKPTASQRTKGNLSQPSRTTASHEGRSPAQTSPSLPASPYDDILALQQSVGNRAASQLLQSSKEDHSLPTKGIPPVIQSVLNRSNGQPLDSVTRGLMEARFAKDFSQVRVHTDSQAATSARAVDANAYTVGSHIAFDRDQYKPNTEEGRRLLSHELSHVLQQQSTAPEVQLERKRRKRKKQKAAKPLDLDDPAVRGKTFEKAEADAWKQDLHKQGYTEVYINKQGDFKTNELLKKAFRDKRAGPDLVAIDHKNKKILVGDVTAGAWSQADIKPGGKRQLPHDIGAPEEKRPHLEKTVDDAKQLARNLPDEYKDYTVVARDRYREDDRTQHSREVVVKKGVTPSMGGSSKTTADKPATSGQTSQKTKATAPPAAKAGSTPAAPKPAKGQLPASGRVTTELAKNTDFQTSGRVTHTDRTGAVPRSSGAQMKGRGGSSQPRYKGAGLAADLLPGAMSALQDKVLRHRVASDMLGQWSMLEKWRKDYPQHVIAAVVSFQEWEHPDGSGMVARSVNYVRFFHGATYDEALAKSRGVVQTGVPKGWQEVGPFIGWIEPGDSLDEAKEMVESQGGCFIVTACYDSQFAPEVILLDAFHQAMLRRSRLGRAFIEFYLEKAPPIAHYLRQHDRLRTLIRQVILTPIVVLVQWSAPWWELEQ